MDEHMFLMCYSVICQLRTSSTVSDWDRQFYMQSYRTDAIVDWDGPWSKMQSVMNEEMED